MPREASCIGVNVQVSPFMACRDILGGTETTDLAPTCRIYRTWTPRCSQLGKIVKIVKPLVMYLATAEVREYSWIL